LAKGSFARTGSVKTVEFTQVQKAKYIRFVAIQGFSGQKWASIAELKLLAPEGNIVNK